MSDPKSFPPIDPSTKIVVLTGAGISAESGIRTFRETGGLWEEYRIEDVATPEAFEKDPDLVWSFYNERRRRAADVKPNPAHLALAKLEEHLAPENFVVVTQNVDNLHRMAGSKSVLHMHGELASVRCVKCGTVTETLEQFEGVPHCDCGGMLRPHIVWFGEIPMHLEEIQERLRTCDVFLAVGTSGLVHPAASFLAAAGAAGATTVGVNLEDPANVRYFDHFYRGRAGEILPGLVDEWISDLSD
jgi:NAD-dependent deacetylase